MIFHFQNTKVTVEIRLQLPFFSKCENYEISLSCTISILLISKYSKMLSKFQVVWYCNQTLNRRRSGLSIRIHGFMNHTILKQK